MESSVIQKTAGGREDARAWPGNHLPGKAEILSIKAGLMPASSR
jgi:hypothetical protein